MANVSAGNSSYVDATGVLKSDKGTKVAYVVLTATAANAVLVLQDNAGTPVNKCNFKVATDGSSQTFDFSSNPIVFPNGVKASTVTNAIALVVYA
jgi:hypothetical protein